MKKKHVACLMVLVLLLSGCAGGTQPTAAPVPTAVILLDQSNSPVPVATDVVASLVPHGQPVSEWGGIPIMPGAIDGQGDANTYQFTIQASVQEIQSFYEKELARLGWEIMGVGKGDKDALLLVFDSGDTALSISILPNGDTPLVVIAK